MQALCDKSRVRKLTLAPMLRFAMKCVEICLAIRSEKKQNHGPSPKELHSTTWAFEFCPPVLTVWNANAAGGVLVSSSMRCAVPWPYRGNSGFNRRNNNA